MNHLNHKTYQKARDLILASEGRTLEDELEFGCHVINEDGEFILDSNVEIEFVYKGTESEVKYLTYCNHVPLGNYRKECSKENSFEILGRPIPLARVLMALGQRKYVCEVSKEYKSVDFYNYYDEDEDLPSFNLGQPLHFQPLETIEKIVEILEDNCHDNNK